MLARERRHLHYPIITSALLDDVLPTLKDDPWFPERVDYKTNEAQHSDRMRIWQGFVDENPPVVHLFFAPLAESIALNIVERMHNPGHEVLFRWANECLVMALERAFTFGRDVGQDEHGRRPGVNVAANKLSSAWENLAQHPQWRVQLDNLPIPIPANFGGGRHTSKKKQNETHFAWNLFFYTLFDRL
jgi:hypothetical protein